MAKGQNRGNREPKKPKASAKKPPAGTSASQFQLAAKPAPTKGNSK